jgi:hypothetical protein
MIDGQQASSIDFIPSFVRSNFGKKKGKEKIERIKGKKGKRRSSRSKALN